MPLFSSTKTTQHKQFIERGEETRQEKKTKYPVQKPLLRGFHFILMNSEPVKNFKTTNDMVIFTL
jgi:hypothetical protein